MGEEVKFIVQKLPVLNKRIVLKKDFLKSKIRLLKPAFKEDVVIETEKCDYLPGELRKVTVINRQYYANNTMKTIAKFETKSGILYEKTSEELVKLIGQANYDTVFSSLCSVFNQELKIRGILSLLTAPKKNNNVSSQVDLKMETKEKADKSCQTNARDPIVKPWVRRKRQALTPYIVQDHSEPEYKLKKLVIEPDDFKKLLPSLKMEDHLQELGKELFNENSNDSIGNLSSLSVNTTPELLKDPSKLLDNVDKHTKNVSNDISRNHELNRSPVSSLPASPCMSENSIQTATATMIGQIMPEQMMKMRLQQASHDWKNCLHRDEDGYLPIHVAVLKNDVNLLKRQCIILKIRNENVDIPATGSLTALKMSLYQENGVMTAMLLNFGADPMATDEDNRTSFHIAAEMVQDHMQALVNHCRRFAKNILHDEELWKPEFEVKSDGELSKYLFNHICKQYDSQGYTPLMLASKMGKYTNVRQLVEVAPEAVNIQTPNSGNTALYLAVGAACMDSAERGNKAKVGDNFRQTIEILLENGSDPNITNFSNSNVNDLVTEYTCSELSMLIANKLTAVKFMPGDSMVGKNFDSYMLVKQKDGKVDLIDMGINKNAKNKPIIVANELYKAGSSDVKTSPVNNKLGKTIGNLERQLSKGSSDKMLKDGVNSDGPMVKNYKLNKPLLIKTLPNYKRKLAITIEPETQAKKTNKSNKNK